MLLLDGSTESDGSVLSSNFLTIETSFGMIFIAPSDWISKRPPSGLIALRVLDKPDFSTL